MNFTDLVISILLLWILNLRVTPVAFLQNILAWNLSGLAIMLLFLN